jgi:hypothetical protein
MVEIIVSPLKLVLSGSFSKHGKGRSKDPDSSGRRNYGDETDGTEAKSLQSGWLSASAPPLLQETLSPLSASSSLP